MLARDATLVGDSILRIALGAGDEARDGVMLHLPPAVKSPESAIFRGIFKDQTPGAQADS